MALITESALAGVRRHSGADSLLTERVRKQEQVETYDDFLPHASKDKELTAERRLLMKAAIYARYSTDKQRDASIDDQFRACDRVARTAGFDVVARFEDKGISGGTADRPGYQALLSATRRREFSVIVVEDISRLWRNRAEFGPRSAEFEDFGVHCVTAVGDDTRRDGWGLIIQIKQAVAELHDFS